MSYSHVISRHLSDPSHSAGIAVLPEYSNLVALTNQQTQSWQDITINSLKSHHTTATTSTLSAHIMVLVPRTTQRLMIQMAYIRMPRLGLRRIVGIVISTRNAAMKLMIGTSRYVGSIFCLRERRNTAILNPSLYLFLMFIEDKVGLIWASCRHGVIWATLSASLSIIDGK